MSIATSFSTIIILIGTRIVWTESFADYPSTEYNCKLQIRSGAEDKLEIDSIPDGSDFKFTIEIADTQKLTTGENHFLFVITKQSDGSLVDHITGSRSIASDLSTDPRSINKIIYDNLSEMVQRSSGREQGIITTPDGVNIEFRSLQEVHTLRAKYWNLWQQEKNVFKKKRQINFTL